MSLTIAKAKDTKACLAIRRSVFIEEQGVAETLELEGETPACLHYLACDGETPLATLRITPMGTVAKIERVAVLKSARGKGIGASLMRHVLVALRAKGFTEAKLGSQIAAQAFYERLGFTAYGAPFLDAGIPHIMMSSAL